MDGKKTTSNIILTLSAASFVGNIPRYSIAPLVPDITDSFGVTTPQLGLALTGMYFGFAGVQFIGGILSDVLGEKLTILFSSALISVGSAVMFASGSFYIFFVGVVQLGAGTGMLLISSQIYVSQAFDETGGKIGLITTGTSISGLAVPIVAVEVNNTYDWRAMMVISIGLSIPIIIGIYTQVASTSYDASTERPHGVRAGFDSVVDRQVLTLILLASLLYFSIQTMGSFFPTMLLNINGDITQQTAGAALSIFFLLVAVGNPLFGRVSEYIGRTPVLYSCLGISAVGFGVIAVSENRLAIYAGTLLLGVGFGWNSTLASKLMELFSESKRGTGYGATNTVANVLGSSGSAVSSFFASQYSWQGTAALLMCIMLIAVTVLTVDSTTMANPRADVK